MKQKSTDVEVRKYVVGFIFYLDQVILLVKNHPEWQNGYCNGVGGKIEDDEYPDETMNRECKESLGLELNWKQYVTIYGSDYKLFVFKTQINNDQYNMLPTENTVGEHLVKVQTSEIRNIRQYIADLPVLIELANIPKINTAQIFMK